MPVGADVVSLTRDQILGYRRRASYLETRLKFASRSLMKAAHAGLTDSMPRAALLSLHARVDAIEPNSWGDESLAQVWGPRFSAYVVAAGDHAPFTLGRMPRSGNRRAMAEETVARLAAFLGNERMEYSAAGKAMGVSPNSLRYATLTGRVMIRWEGSGKPLIWVVAEPTIGEEEARRELLRRYLHVFGVGTVDGFGSWAGVNRTQASLTFDEIAAELLPVATPLGAAAALLANEAELRKKTDRSHTVRLLPSGDTYFLLHGDDRPLLVPDEGRRPELWTSRVWPGAVLVGNEIAGTWRRSGGAISISLWADLSGAQRTAVTAEAESFPIDQQPIEVSWD